MKQSDLSRIEQPLRTGWGINTGYRTRNECYGPTVHDEKFGYRVALFPLKLMRF